MASCRYSIMRGWKVMQVRHHAGTTLSQAEAGTVVRGKLRLH